MNLPAEQRIIELCRRMIGRNARLKINLAEHKNYLADKPTENPPIQLNFFSPSARTPKAFFEPWVESFCAVSYETYQSALRAGAIGMVEGDAKFAFYKVKSAGRILVRNQTTQIVDVTKTERWFDVYCGRPSDWGNTCKIQSDTAQERKRAVAEFDQHINQNPALIKKCGFLKGLRIGCWCMDVEKLTPQTPDLCHCVIVAAIANEFPIDAKGRLIDFDGQSCFDCNYAGVGSNGAVAIRAYPLTVPHAAHG